MNKKLFFLLNISFLCLLSNAQQEEEMPKGDEWRKKAFNYIYHKKHWWDGESFSGPGSSLAVTSTLRLLLPSIVKAIGAQSMLDAGCGDFNWMKELDLELDLYIGVDIVPALIKHNRAEHGQEGRVFFCLDVVKDPLPQVDVILCRDCLAHLSYEDIDDALRNFKRSGAKYLLASDFPHMKKNDAPMKTGDFRPVNLRVAPYLFPEPIMSFSELDAEYKMKRWGKRLSLWLLDDIVLD